MDSHSLRVASSLYDAQLNVFMVRGKGHFRFDTLVGSRESLIRDLCISLLALLIFELVTELLALLLKAGELLLLLSYHAFLSRQLLHLRSCEKTSYINVRRYVAVM